jgi:uncharacterized protein
MTLSAIDVRDLVGNPGAFREHTLRGTMEGLGTEVASLREDTPVEGDLLLESVVEGILVSGRLRGTLDLRCARCLKQFERPIEVEVAERFVADPDDEEYRLEPEGLLEPEQMVRDAVGLELPFSPLCREDCLGLCEVCGGDRNAGECPGHDQIDPRWAALEHAFDGLDVGQNQN